MLWMLGAGLWLTSFTLSSCVTYREIGLLAHAIDDLRSSPVAVTLILIWVVAIVLGYGAPLMVPVLWGVSRAAAIPIALLGGTALLFLAVKEASWTPASDELAALLPLFFGLDLRLAGVVAKLGLAVTAGVLWALPPCRSQGSAACTPSPRARLIAGSRGAEDVGPEVVLAALERVVQDRAACLPNWVLARNCNELLISQGKLAPVLGVSKATLCRRLQRLQARGHVQVIARGKGTWVKLLTC